MAVSPTIVLILLQRRTSLGLTLGIIGPLESSVVNKPV